MLQRTPRLLVDLEIAAALVVAAVEVLGLGDARPRRPRLAECVEDLPVQALLLDPPFAAGAVQLVGPVEVVLGPLEVGQDVVPAPAGVAQLAPAVVVRGLAAHVDHAVDRRAAAQHLAARIIEHATAESRLGLGLEAPVGARIADAVEIADRDVDPGIVVLAAGLEQQDRYRGIGGQPVGEHAAGGAGADDDVVEAADMACCAVGRAQRRCLPSVHLRYISNQPRRRSPPNCPLRALAGRGRDPRRRFRCPEPGTWPGGAAELASTGSRRGTSVERSSSGDRHGVGHRSVCGQGLSIGERLTRTDRRALTPAPG